MRFFTSDTHFGHAQIIEYAHRPFKDVNHMNTVMVAKWNERVGPEDLVYHLGDVALGNLASSLHIVSRLNGYKILVAGNHDRVSTTKDEKYRARFTDDYLRVFNEIHDETTAGVVIAEQFVRLSHYPYEGGSRQEDSRFNAFRLEDRGTILVHGHTHSFHRISFSKKRTPQIHVGVDSWDYAPVSENEIAEIIRGLRP